MKHTNRRRMRGTLGILTICALPFLLVACSTASDDGETVAKATSGIGAQWGSCMRDAGFDVQDPDDGSISSGVTSIPAGQDQEAFSAASATCAKKVGVEGTSSAQKQKWDREYAQVESCIRDAYPDFPQQEPGVISTGGYARAEEPEFQKVYGDCLAEYSPDNQTRRVG